MTFNATKILDSRKPITVCELYLDACRYEYGNSYTNLLTYSEQFDHANWTKTRLGTTIANAALAPDGNLTADKIIEDATASNTHFITQAATIALGATGLSVYVKASERTEFRLEVYNATDGSIYSDFDLSDESITNGTGSTGKIEELFDGWYRCSITCTTTAANSSAYLYLMSSAATSYSGDGASGLYLWGMQMVAGSSIGHYVTTTTASAAGACAATGSAGEECYNTYASCQDTDNFSKILKRYRFFQSSNELPIGEKGYPCLTGKPRFTPCQIDPKGSLGRRGIVAVNFEDFADDDVETDPYYSTRTYDPESQGTFFGKLKKRMPYYKGRLMKVKQGFLNDSFSWNDFQSKTYVIDSLDVDLSGRVSIKGKDMLKLADDKRSVAPEASTGTLSAAYTAGVSTTLVLQTGEGTDYNTDPFTGSAISGSVVGYVRVGDNVLQYTGVSTDTLTGVTGGHFGSEDADAAIDDSVQQCLYLDDKNAIDIIHYLLNTGAGIPETYLPYDAGLATPTGTNDEWDEEFDSWLSGNDLTHIITEPTGIKELLQRICEQNLIYMWFNEIDQEIKLKAIAPSLGNEIPPTLNEDSHIVEGSVDIVDNEKNRISQIWVYYDQINVTEDREDPANYNRLKLQVDTTNDSENENAYAEKAIRVIYADWFTSGNAGLIITLAGRLLSRYSGTPKKVKFQLDNKDSSIWSGSSLKLQSKYFQDFDGSTLTQNLQVLKAHDDHDKQLVYLEGETWDFVVNRYGFIAANSMGDYTAESTANQDAYGFISQNDEEYSNGDAAHLIA